MKKGFTLVELLVVIAIIAILSIIIVPSVINVNKNVNNRLLDSKKENITSAAQIYASKNDDIFNGVDEVPVFVYELIDMGYLDIDVVANDDNRCDSDDETGGAKGCLLNPTAEGTLNHDYVIIRKQGAIGYYVEYHPSSDLLGAGTVVSEKTLVTAVCEALNSESNPLTAKATSGANAEACTCHDTDNDDKFDTLKAGNTVVNACIISGENPNNYLRYGDSKPNWRVLGVYKINNELYAKIITSEPI